MSIYRSPKGEAAIHTLYDRQLARLDIAVESRMIPTRFGVTHVLVGGPQDGAPLIILHGGNTIGPNTLGWFKPLTSKYRVYAPDTIGQPGKSAPVRISPRDNSYGQWIVDVLDGLGLDRVAVAAVSHGAGILLRTAAYAPERITKAILIVPSGIISISLSTMLFDLLVPLLAYRLVPNRERLLRVLRPLFLSDPIPEDMVEITDAVFRYTKIEAEMPRNVTKEEMTRFTAPTLVLAAEKDRMFPAQQVLARARQVFPNLSAAEVIPGSPHFISPSYHLTLNQRMDRFLQGGQ